MSCLDFNPKGQKLTWVFCAPASSKEGMDPRLIELTNPAIPLDMSHLGELLKNTDAQVLPPRDSDFAALK